MTIDEAIEMKKKDNAFNKSIGCDTSYEEQIVEWLEELKTIKGDGFTDDLLNMGFTKGYNKAIDDFAEKLNAKCDGMIKDKWNSNVAPISWAEAYADFKDDIDDIAEQLKAGGDNDD